jgi:SAM-dependent methyltransferase
MTSGSASSISRVSIELPGWEGLGSGLEVSVLCVGQDGPADTLGTWVFDCASPGPAALEIDWLAEGEGTLALVTPEGRDAPVLVRALRQADAVVRPEMLVRVACGAQALEVPVKVTETDALERYYQAEDHQQEYVTQHPFFNAFHEARLRSLGKIYRETIRPGSKVLDVGSGYSIFYMTRPWDFDMICCDLDAAAMQKMIGLCPEWTWMVADAVHLPFEDSAFDAVYAGEIIEHVPDARTALAEWRRVLKPGGTLIVTTPNRDRLVARANRVAMPVHPEHVREMSLGEARATLIAEGFAVEKVTGIYLEVLLNWHRPPGRRVDLLTARFTKPEHERIYKPFMWAGRLAPSRAFDLIFVCKNQ